MDLHLIDGGNHRGLGQKAVKVMRHKIADANGPHPAVGEQYLQRFVGGDGPVKRQRQRLVQNQQVDLVHAELEGAFVERVQGRLVPVVADPYLRLEEHVRAVHPRAPDCFADLAFVAVAGGSINVPVAGTQRVLDCGDRLLRRRLKHAVPKCREFDAVVEGECGNCRWVRSCHYVSS